jgi:hypothetical protein
MIQIARLAQEDKLQVCVGMPNDGVPTSVERALEPFTFDDEGGRVLRVGDIADVDVVVREEGFRSYCA